MPNPAQNQNLPFPWKTGLQLLRDATRQKHRSFREDAVNCISLLSPAPKILQPQNIPLFGPALLVMNHYSRPGFGAWWIAFGISSQMQDEVHWMMTSGWNHAGLFAPLTRWLFPRLAQVYGFTITPPMPPTSDEIEARAEAVRAVLRVAKSAQTKIAIAPEGQDHPGGIITSPPVGVGRFLIQLSKYRERITPIGVYEDDTSLCFNFGPSFILDIPARLPPDNRDLMASQVVMEAIANLLPMKFRGEFG